MLSLMQLLLLLRSIKVETSAGVFDEGFLCFLLLLLPLQQMLILTYQLIHC